MTNSKIINVVFNDEYQILIYRFPIDFCKEFAN
jgi:hypothetical protein